MRERDSLLRQAARCILAVGIASALAPTDPALAQKPWVHLVKDINPSTQGTGLLELEQVGDTLFFKTDDGIHGLELWRKTGGGASELVSDIRSGVEGSNPSKLTNVGGTLFFTTFDQDHGTELWKSDGTADSTVLVEDINIGADGSDPYNLVASGTTLFFVANDGVNGYELWKTESTNPGAELVKAIRPGSEGSNPAAMTSMNGLVFFGADDGTGVYKLWRSDGTADGTVPLAHITPAGSNGWVSSLLPVGTTLFFWMDDSSPGCELWRTNGLPTDTALVKHFDAASVSNLTRVGDDLFFLTSDPVQGHTLWTSNGTDAGTVMVKQIEPGHGSYGSFPLINAGGRLFFTAHNSGARELWTSDGTSGGTVPVKEAFVAFLTPVGDILFFTLESPPYGIELWKTDGTVTGTVLVKDIYPGAEGSEPLDLTEVSGTLYFRADDGTHGDELWQSDGTAGGTMLVEDINAVPSLAKPPRHLTDVAGTLFFSAYDGAHGYELWKSDGTLGGTTLVGDLVPGTESSHPYQLTNVNGTLFFVANAGTEGAELWKTDVTGIARVAAGGTGTKPLSPNHLVAMHDLLFFSAYEEATGYELWISDGTAEGTKVLKDINIGDQSSSPTNLVLVEGTLFFLADDGATGREWWKSDGTEGGTTRVADLRPNADGLQVISSAGFGSKLFFQAAPDASGFELWTIDTSDGTASLVRTFPAAMSWYNFNLTAVGNAVFFRADDGVSGPELWKSDGTDLGTSLAMDINGGAVGSYPACLVNLNGVLMFWAAQGAAAHIVPPNLWRSDGADTTLVKQVKPGPVSPAMAACTQQGVVGGKLYFGGTTSSNDVELWRSNGTPVGTARLEDIVPGPEPSVPGQLADVGGVPYFVAYTPAHGPEIWTVATSTCGNGVVEGEECDDGNLDDCDGCDSDCTKQVCGNSILCFPERCDDGNTSSGDGCTDACRLDADSLRCMKSIAMGAYSFVDRRLLALQKCRNAINQGVLAIDPTTCESQPSTKKAIDSGGLLLRKRVVMKCTDQLVAGSDACASQIADLVSVNGKDGCLVTVHSWAIDLMIASEYGRVLAPTELPERECQVAIAAAARSFAKNALRRLQSCRRDVASLKLDIDPATCAQEPSAAAHLSAMGVTLRTKISTACTPLALTSLKSCGATLDELVTADGTGGCLVTGHLQAIDKAVAAEF